MGDRVAITTWPKHQNLFYLVASSGLSFDVKAVGNAVVGLARKPGSKIDYWWNAGYIKFGRHGDQKPIVTYPNKIPELKYITFGALNHHNPVHWKFDLPPVRESIQLNKPISNGKLRWVEVNNPQHPDGALIGGFENEILYIIRASHRGSMTLGKFLPSQRVGFISWGGNSHEKNELEMLCGFDCSWVPTYEDRIPVGAFVGGYSEDRQERLYIGRAVHEGHIIPGKVQPSHKVCYIAFEGREIGKKKFDILVEPNNVRSANDTFMSDMHVESASESDQDDDNTWQADDDDNDYDDMYGYVSNDELNEVMAL